MLTLNNLSISKRLSVGFGAIGAALLVITVVAIQGLGALHRGIDAVQLEARRASVTRDMVNTLTESNLAILQLACEKDETGRGMQSDVIGILRTQYEGKMTILKDGADPEDLTLLGGIETALDSTREGYTEIMNLANSGRGEEARRFCLEKSRELRSAVNQACKRFLTLRADRLIMVQARLKATQDRVRLIIILATFVGLVVAGWIGWRITRIYVSDIATMGGHTKLMAGGNLSQSIPPEYLARHDEIGSFARDYQVMVDNLRNLIQGLHGGVRAVASSATELSASADQMAATTATLAQTSNSQKEMADAMAATMDHLSTSIGAVRHSAEDAIALMEETLTATQEGDIAGVATRAAMEGVTHSAQQISAATVVIGELANQTNLLSLNAAIEAAKAGDMGRGFSVVAEEVRKLAERSAFSAKEIATLILVAQRAVDQGGTTVAATVQSLTKIRMSLERFADRTRQISAAAADQSQASQEVVQRVGHTVRDAAASAAGASEMAAATSEIARTAADLANVADQLRLQVEAFSL